MVDVQEDSSLIFEEWFVKCYVNGLRSNIKFQLRSLRPTSLTEAYWLAVDMEKGTTEKKALRSRTSTSKSYTGTPSLWFYRHQSEGCRPLMRQGDLHIKSGRLEPTFLM